MNKKQIKLVPKYRFPEFATEEEWKAIPLRTIANKVTAKNKDGLVSRVLTNSATDGVVDQKDYFEREIVTQGNISNYFIVSDGDYIYNPRISSSAPVGPISKNKIGIGIMSPLYTVFRFKDSENDFYEQYFKTNLWNNYLKTIANTGARFDRISISANDFMSMPMPVSSNTEQQKIADCLSSIDDLISAEDKKLSALKNHKKGLMQKLFPAEGKTVPEWRFPEFRNDEEWNEFKISDVGEVITGSTPSTNKSEYYGGSFMFASPADISDKRYLYSTNTTLTKLGFQKTRPIEANSILFVCIGSTIGKMAQNKEICATNQQINSLVPYESYHNDFLYYTLEYNSAKISGLAGKQAVPIINKTLFSSVEILLPTKKSEQQKIADLLSSVDELITSQTDKIESLKKHKKGLMQGLFPSIEEVIR